MNLRIALGPQPCPSPRLLKDSGLEAFFWTQFLAGFNVNVYKMLVSLLAAFLQISQQLGPSSLVFVSAVSVLVFLLCYGRAGELADRFHKIRGNS